MRKIVQVRPQDFLLECEMDNGDIYLYDMSFIHQSNGEMLQPLKNLHFFKQVFISLGSLTWPNDYEIHAQTVLREGKRVFQSA